MSAHKTDQSMMTSAGKRVILTEDEGRQLFNDQLPLSGLIEREINSIDGSRWSLLALDRSFDYQVQDSQTRTFRGFTVKKLLIRSRWAGYSVGGTVPTSVFVLIASDQSLFNEDRIDPKGFFFDAWAMCKSEMP